MRRVHVLASAGAALLVASCSGKPNDLAGNRYYEQPETTPRISATAPPPAPAAAPPSSSATRAAAAQLDEFAMTAADLAVEGVRQTGTARTVLTGLPDCQAPLGAARTALQTTWAYPTGSTVRQYLAEYDGGADAVVGALRQDLTCGKYRADNVEVKVSTPAVGANGQLSWCATSPRQSACTVVAAAGPVLSVVVVTAATENKAKPAVTRIAPLAATALARNS